VQGHISFEELFGLFDLPYTQAGVFVDLMLKKNGQVRDFRLMIADFRFIIAKKFEITVSLPSKDKNVEECDARKAK